MIQFIYIGGPVVAALLYMYLPTSTPTPNEYLKSAVLKPNPGIESPLGRICLAHNLIARLETSMPDKATTILDILSLDATQPPFFPPDSCAAPVNENYKLANDAVMDAWIDALLRLQEDNVAQWRYAAAACAATTLDANARTVYLREIWPNVRDKGNLGWRSVCETAGLVDAEKA